jgi:hypothetical protein
MKLIDDARQGWRFLSVRLGIAGIALPQVWVALPQDQREAVLDLFGLKGLAALISLLFALIVAARLIHQSNLDQPKEPQ